MFVKKQAGTPQQTLAARWLLYMPLGGLLLGLTTTASQCDFIPDVYEEVTPDAAYVLSMPDKHCAISIYHKHACICCTTQHKDAQRQTVIHVKPFVDETHLVLCRKN